MRILRGLGTGLAILLTLQGLWDQSYYHYGLFGLSLLVIMVAGLEFALIVNEHKLAKYESSNKPTGT